MESPKKDWDASTPGQEYRLGYERRYRNRPFDQNEAEPGFEWDKRPSRLAGSEAPQAPRDALNRVGEVVTAFTNRVVAEPGLDVVESVNKLLRSELAATETYRQELEKIRDEYGCDAQFLQLARVQRGHERAAEELRLMVQELGGDAEDGSGHLDTWYDIVMGATSICDDRASLSLLLHGEKSGLDNYSQALKDDRLPDEIKHSLRMRLVKYQEHVRTLEQMIESI